LLGVFLIPLAITIHIISRRVKDKNSIQKYRILHKIIAFFAVLITIIAVIIALSDMEWEVDTTHGSIGIIVLSLAFIQINTGYFNKSMPSWWKQNKLHPISGATIFTLSIIACYSGAKRFKDAYDEKALYSIILILIPIAIISIFAFQFGFYVSEPQSFNMSGTLSFTNMSTDYEIKKKKAEGNIVGKKNSKGMEEKI